MSKWVKIFVTIFFSFPLPINSCTMGTEQMGKTIGIIGTGISGLLACKYTMEQGFNPIVFEAQSDIGGVWSKTIESTKLQTPKHIYQFSDLAWPHSVRETFPDRNQVMEYLKSYAMHFNILGRIKFNSKVINVDYVMPSHEDMLSWDLWGGTGGGEPFSPTGKWNITVTTTKVISLEPLLEHSQPIWVVFSILQL